VDRHPDLADVHAARRRIAGLVCRTPLLASDSLSARLGAEVRFKVESLQPTRAFKLRGAANAILAAPEAARRRGIVTYSTGNHGRAAAYVAGRLGIPATVCVSTRTDVAKIVALRGTGARIVIEGNSQDEAAERAYHLAHDDGLVVVDPINDPCTISGHGTIGLEILEDFPAVDTLVVPVSGGALISGIALAVRSANPSVRVIGVSMAGGAAMHDSLAAGNPVTVAEVETLADSLQGGILLDNRHTFAMVRALVERIVLVSEDEIARALSHALRCEGLVLEGAAATPVAALAFRERALFGRRIVAVLTGSMIDVATLMDVAQAHPAGLDRIAGP